jgi:hypothetical protein
MENRGAKALFYGMEEYLGLGGRGWLVLRMKAGMNDPIHVEVQIIELDTVGIGLRNVNWHFRYSYQLWLFFHAVHHYFRIPAVSCVRCKRAMIKALEGCNFFETLLECSYVSYL